MIEKQPSCDDPIEPELLPVATALARMRSEITAVTGTKKVNLRESLGHVLASDLVSPIQVPAYTNSAMDGYAINSADLPADDGEVSLKVLGTAWAGRPVSTEIKRGETVRIMTGGMLPKGADTVVIQEHVQALDQAPDMAPDNAPDIASDDEYIVIDGTTTAGRNVRHAGEDINTGDTVLSGGTLINPAELGLIASLGIDQVEVRRRLKVAFFSTGDELRALETHAGNTLGPGEIFDSNRHTLFALLSRLGVELIDLGVVADTAEATRAAVVEASEKADLVITSGGVSAGQADFVSQTIAELGDVTFWKLAMRPGRPLACGVVNSCRFFGLPGNPVAVMVTFYEFVQPTIKAMMGCTDIDQQLFTVAAAESIRKVPGRIEYQRGIIEVDADGVQTVRTTGKQGAGRLSSMCLANCLIVLPVECDGVAVGDLVQVRPFHGLV